MPPFPSPSPRAAEIARTLAFVVAAVVCVGFGHHGLTGTDALLWALWAPSTGAFALVAARTIRSSPIEPRLLPSVVALPLLSAIVQTLLASPAARGLRGALFDEARDGTLRLTVLGILLGIEWALRARPALPIPERHVGLLALVAAAIICELALDASYIATLVGKGTTWGAFDVTAARALAVLARTIVGAAIEIALLVAIAICTLANRPSWRTVPPAVLLLVLSAGLLLLAPRARAALRMHDDPLQMAVELGIDPPTESWEASMWVGSTSTWRHDTPLLLLRDAAPGAYLERPRGSAAFRTAPLLPMRTTKSEWGQDPEDHDIVVLTDGGTRFQDFALGLGVLGERRHGLWLPVAPEGWRTLGPLRRLAERAEVVALGMEPLPIFEGDAVPSDRALPDPLLGEMDPEGDTLALLVQGAEARCMRMVATLDGGRLRYVRRGDCGTLPLVAGPAGRERRLALMRETAATHILLAPPLAATMDEVIRDVGMLSSELTFTMNERWKLVCPPPTRCEPHISFRTGSPLVWLTTARDRLPPPLAPTPH